jgi:hypothetical protein
MAKLPRTGVAYRSPDEREVTLAEIVASLGLKPLSKKAEREIRDRLGFALATWDEPYTALQIKDIAGALKAHAKRLDQIAPLGTITRSGFAREHDIAVGGQLIQILASNPAIGSVEAAHEYLRNFCDGVSMMASSCRAAAMSLQSRKGQSGKSRYGWYDEFTAVLLDVCKQNKIEPTVGIDRISGEPVGTLPKIASAFEHLLPPKMRSRKPATMVKRLQRSLSRLAQRVHAASGSATPRGEHHPKRA